MTLYSEPGYAVLMTALDGSDDVGTDNKGIK